MFGWIGPYNLLYKFKSEAETAGGGIVYINRLGFKRFDLISRILTK